MDDSRNELLTYLLEIYLKINPRNLYTNVFEGILNNDYFWNTHYFTKYVWGSDQKSQTLTIYDIVILSKRIFF